MKYKSSLRATNRICLVIVATIALHVTPDHAIAQNNRPQLGKKIPDFQLNDVSNYRSKTITPDVAKGKWLVLEFWAPSCFSCIKKFPAFNAIQKELKQDLDWVLVGVMDEYNINTKEFYNKVRTRDKIELPYAFDSTVVNKWDVHGMPRIFIIDPQNIVRAITNGSDIDLEKIKMLMRGGKVEFAKIREERVPFEPDKINSLAIASSLLTPSLGEEQYTAYPLRFASRKPIDHRKDGYTLACVNAEMLYLYAFVGQSWWSEGDSLYGLVHPTPILETKDSSKFVYDFGSGKNIYNYHVTLPPDQMTTIGIMTAMQQDLERAFGYATTIEERPVPVYSVSIGHMAADRMRSKGKQQGVRRGENTMFGFSVKHLPRTKIQAYLTSYLLGEERLTPWFFDMASLPEFVDLDIQGDLSTIDGINTAIKKYDLSIVKTTASLKAVVIRDKKVD